MKQTFIILSSLFTLCISTSLLAAPVDAAPAKESLAIKMSQSKKEIAFNDAPEIKKEIDQTDTLAIPFDSSEAEETMEASQLQEIQARKNAQKMANKSLSCPKK